ncbi:hypothetical protein WQ56_12855 [Luteimonas sp. FCS-9]|nr:hypothetical protein WQ56_12855 [Luteimonas sp. FCS-9]
MAQRRSPRATSCRSSMVTIDHADALNRLAQTLMVHGDVLASGHKDDLADATIPALGLVI